jgi:hypothetical protein
MLACDFCGGKDNSVENLKLKDIECDVLPKEFDCCTNCKNVIDTEFKLARDYSITVRNKIFKEALLERLFKIPF